MCDFDRERDGFYSMSGVDGCDRTLRWSPATSGGLDVEAVVRQQAKADEGSGEVGLLRSASERQQEAMGGYSVR